MGADLRILLIDDDDDDRTLAESVLGQRVPGCVVVEAGNALDFALAFADGDFQVAIAALELGWGSGAEVLRSVKRRNPRCATILLTRAAGELGDPESEPRVDAVLRKSSAGFVQLPRAVADARRRATEPAGGAISGWSERLWQQLPVGVLTLSEDGEILAANRALAATLGFGSVSDLVGRQLPDLLTDREVRVRLRRQLELGESCESLPVQIRTTNGAPVAGALSLWPIGEGGGEARRFQGLLVDSAGAVATANDPELGELTATLFHELQDPLQLLAQYSHLLAEGYESGLAEEGSDLVRRVEDVARRLQGMVRGMVDYISSRRDRLQAFEPVALDDTLADALTEIGDQVAASGAVVTAEGLPVVVGERRQLRELFRQLVTNAIKFRSTAPPRVAIRAEERANDWLLSVTDNGIGIGPENAERVFGVFQRVHDPDEYPGSGVGLSICRRIAELHGGDIWVRESAEGGSTFLLTLSKHLPRRRPGPAGADARDGRPLGNLHHH